MNKIILFSNPLTVDREKFLKELFPKELENKTFAYMPSDGNNNPEKFTNIWKNIAQENNAKFIYINNASNNPQEEIEKLRKANILLITGGNTFGLLHRLKKTGLDKTIIEMANKENSVIAGFSAGALVLTPNIEVCKLEKYDPNDIGLEDLTALALVDFEIFPHYKKEDEKTLQEYYSKTHNNVLPITDEEYLAINK